MPTFNLTDFRDLYREGDQYYNKGEKKRVHGDATCDVPEQPIVFQAGGVYNELRETMNLVQLCVNNKLGKCDVNGATCPLNGTVIQELKDRQYI